MRFRPINRTAAREHFRFCVDRQGYGRLLSRRTLSSPAAARETLNFRSALSAAVGCSAGFGAVLVPDRQVQEHQAEAGAGRLLHLCDPDAGPTGEPLVHGRLDLASVLDSGAGTAEETRALVRQLECEELHFHG